MLLLNFRQIISCTAILLLAYSSPARASNNGILRTCIVTLDTGDGEWVASRDLTEHPDRVEVTSDDFVWESNQTITFDSDASLRWQLNYWPSGPVNSRKIDDRDFSLLLDFDFQVSAKEGEPKKPDTTWLHLFRSDDPKERRLGSTSLSTNMWWNKSSSGAVSGKASIPLDHLLAFGQGFDELAWNIQSAPDRYGATQKLARGTLPISTLRDRKAAIPQLRKMLDKMAKRYKQECHVPITVSISP